MSSCQVKLLALLLLIHALARGSSGQLNFTSCGDLCSDYGTCNPETQICECPQVRHGPDCSIPLSDPEPVCRANSHTLLTCDSSSRALCLNSCNGRGWCEGGFCHCRPGFYGADCSLSLGPDGRPVLLAGQGYVPRRHGVKIYVYELPPIANTWVNIARIDRPLAQLLMQRLLSAGVRTTEGDEADYYFIPFTLRTRAHAHAHLSATIYYIRKHWPWWDRHGGGHRHLLAAPVDQGRRALPEELLQLTANVTFLTHWGLHTDHSVGRWRQAHRPGQDIVIPPLMAADDPITYSPLHKKLRKRERKRRRGVFFAGRICGGGEEPVEGRCSELRREFSGNTRQRVAEHHWNRTGWTITTRTPALAAGMASHAFCLVPAGSSYGRRSAQALLMGCVPVLLTDGVHQPFEPELPWRDFSVSVAERDVPRLHDMLAGVAGEQLERMQKYIPCAAQHMYYSSSYGEVLGDDGRYDAFETLMEILRMRRDHPGLDPLLYLEHDTHFADFVRCALPPTGGKLATCTHNRLVKAKDTPHCREWFSEVPMRSMHVFYSWPGGAVCGRNTTIGDCPRSWL